MPHVHQLSMVLCPSHLHRVQGNVRRHFHETFPAAWLLEEGGGSRQIWKIVAMATTGLLVQSGSAVLPFEYSFIIPPSAAAWAMDRFIPSSRQPQHWSRNYHGSQERRRTMGRRLGSPESPEKDISSYIQGITLRAEDLLVNSESKMGSGSRIPPSCHLATRPGCNADSETCNYCRLSESSEERESSSSSAAGDDRSSSSSPPMPPSPPKLNGECRRLTRALSEECHPPSRLRRTSPGEYLRHKRHQMERLRGAELTPSPSDRHLPPRRLQRSDSEDPRLGRIQHQHQEEEEEDCALSGRRRRRRMNSFASPTRVMRRSASASGRKEGGGVLSPAEVDRGKEARVTNSTEVERSKRSAKMSEQRRSRSQDRTSRSLVLWGAAEPSPYVAATSQRRRGSFRCAVCDCDIPFTNCVLCSAEAKGAGREEGEQEVFVTTQEGDLVSLVSEGDLLILEGEGKLEEVEGEVVPPRDLDPSLENRELEDFYDRPTPVEPAHVPVQPPTSDEKRLQWTAAKGHHPSAHKSFNQEERRTSSKTRRSSLRKYNSEPVPETEDFQYGEQQQQSLQSSSSSSSSLRLNHAEKKAENNVSASSKSESRAGYHVAKDSPRRESPQQKDAKSSCHFCGKTTEDNNKEEIQEVEKSKSGPLSPDLEGNPQRKSPAYLRPQFDFEPEIIHKANPLVDETDEDVLPTAAGAFRRLSEEEFISTLNIHESARKGDLHVVKLLTKKDPKQMETVDERGWTPIHLAAAHGHTEVVKYLAMEGAHLAALDPSSYTAIHLAAMNGHNSILEVLLPMGVDVDSVTSEGFTALHLAVMNCHLDCIQTLLQWGSSLDKRDALGRGINDMVEEYNLQEVAALLRRFHKQLHNFKHMLDIMNREGKNTSEMPREFMDILASIAEESGTE